VERTSATYLAVPRGIKYVAEYSLYSNSTAADARKIAQQLKALNPDAIMWCDWQSCTFPESTHRFSMKHLKAVDYFPKAMGELDCYYQSVTNQFIAQGLMDYVTQPTFTHGALKGQEYTQDANPYSNVFRPSKPVVTVNDEMNCGSSLDRYCARHIPSSPPRVMTHTHAHTPRAEP